MMGDLGALAGEARSLERLEPVTVLGYVSMELYANP
jgi:hypothetical protein